MRWRRAQPCAPAKGRARRTGRAGQAALLSLAVHSVLALLLFRASTRPVVLAPDAVEVTIKTDEEAPSTSIGGPTVLPEARTTDSPRPAPPSSTAVTAKRAPASAAGTTRSDDLDRPTIKPAGTTAEESSAQHPTGSALASGGGIGQADGLSTFLPAHPDLSGGGRFGLLPDKPRDLLAPPTAKARGVTADLPEVLHGGAGVTASVAEDGAIRFHDSKPITYDPVAWSGHFDITDAAMRLAGQDPYSAIKTKMADETREQRICMAKKAQDGRQRQALLGLSAKVKQIAHRVDLTPLARRQLVFEIWDECTEGAGDATMDYGAMARATILAVIRESFPAGSELGYLPAELVALNQRRSSHERFAPYERETGKAQALPKSSARPDGGT
ncbi:MAG TPA: hypothetical protein VF550_17880 [Polyangia bacterium]